MKPEFKITFTWDGDTLAVNYNDGSDDEYYQIEDTADSIIAKIQDIIKDEIHESKSKLPELTFNGAACANCGKPLDIEDKYAVCSDCGAIFCEDCFNNGEMENHTCEDEEDI